MFVAIIMLNVIILGLIVVMAYRANAQNRNQQTLMSDLLGRLNNLQEKLDKQSGKGPHESIFPLRVQAAERLIVLLERIKPGMLVHRHLPNATSAGQLAALMLQNIREEFEYNISQQLYVSERSWQLIQAAREEVVQSVHLALSKIGQEAPPANLATELFSSTLRFPDEALISLRSELNK